MDQSPPQFTDSVDLRFFVEGYSNPSHPINLLDRFPEAVYNKAPDSHFVRFMYTLLGPTGVGWLREALLAARLQYEASGMATTDLERGYGNPFSLARNIEESYANYDISGLLPASVWQQIQAQDEAYRTRATQYLAATRLGGTPEGMALAASSGTGQNCEVIEHYQYLFDQHSDDPLGLVRYGGTLSTNEFVVVPRVTINKSVQQVIKFPGTPFGPFTISYNGYSTSLLAANSTTAQVQTALDALGTPTYKPLKGNVVVTGGPQPAAFTLTFSGALGNGTVYPILANFGDGTSIPVTSTAGVDPSQQAALVKDQDKHAMQTALDFLRPVNTLPTFAQAFSTLKHQAWNTITATSQFPQVIRYVTGSSKVAWPTPDNTHWIVPAVEVEAPRHNQARNTAHYTGFHNPVSVVSYTDTALSDINYGTNSAVVANYASVHVGTFPEMAPVMPYFKQFTDSSIVWSPIKALADHPEPVTVSVQDLDGKAYINHSYPADYAGLQGVPTIANSDHFWSSVARTNGAEILEIDLGSAQAVNYIAMEVTRKPLTVEVDYDLLDQSPARTFVPVNLLDGPPNNSNVFFQGAQNPWQHMEYYFNDGLGMIFTRFIRLVFTRVTGTFLYNQNTKVQTPWSIEVRNLRIGRNVPPSIS